jgi:putative DNA primase/helicase
LASVVFRGGAAVRLPQTGVLDHGQLPTAANGTARVTPLPRTTSSKSSRTVPPRGPRNRRHCAQGNTPSRSGDPHSCASTSITKESSPAINRLTNLVRPIRVDVLTNNAAHSRRCSIHFPGEPAAPHRGSRKGDCYISKHIMSDAAYQPTIPKQVWDGIRQEPAQAEFSIFNGQEEAGRTAPAEPVPLSTDWLVVQLCSQEALAAAPLLLPTPDWIGGEGTDTRYWYPVVHPRSDTITYSDPQQACLLSVDIQGMGLGAHDGRQPEHDPRLPPFDNRAFREAFLSVVVVALLARSLPREARGADVYRGTADELVRAGWRPERVVRTVDALAAVLGAGGTPGADAVAAVRGRVIEPHLRLLLGEQELVIFDELVFPRGRPAAAGSIQLGAREESGDPHRLARLYLGDQLHESGLGQRHWRDEHYRWDGTVYRPLPEGEVRAELCESVKAEADKGKPQQQPTAMKVTARLVSDVLHALVGMTLLPSRYEPPCWLDEAVATPSDLAVEELTGAYELPQGWDELPPASEMLACHNGLVHLPSVAAGDTTIWPTTPKFFTLNGLNYAVDAHAPPPTAWLNFLKQLWPNDPQSIEMVQGWFGYLLTPDTSHQKILLLLGPPRGGKGTILRVLSQLIGKTNICAPTLASLGGPFGLQQLLGKSAALITDARLSGRVDVAAIVEKLLALSGGDWQEVQRKYLPSITVKLPTRFIIATNELPRLTDASSAVVSRLLILQLTRSWLGREDRGLERWLLAELPGILLWAIAGWRRLHERGRFVQPESGRRAVRTMEELSSPIRAFVRDCCEVGPDYRIARSDLYHQWEYWCQTEANIRPTGRSVFGRDLAAAFPEIDDQRPREPDDRRTRMYTGIRLRVPRPFSREAPPDQSQG